jgi:hypothetical protein
VECCLFHVVIPIVLVLRHAGLTPVPLVLDGACFVGDGSMLMSLIVVLLGWIVFCTGGLYVVWFLVPYILLLFQLNPTFMLLVPFVVIYLPIMLRNRFRHVVMVHDDDNVLFLLTVRPVSIRVSSVFWVFILIIAQ